jgi:uncharacterized repeat protein (TIGR01451 family)
MSGPAYAQLPSRAGTTSVFGIFDGSEANAPGEVSFKQGTMVTGVPVGMLTEADSVRIDTVYSLSSLDSVNVQDSLAASPGDTVDFKYWVQHQGNLVSDSFHVIAVLVDTSEPGHYAPAYFRVLDETYTEVGGLTGPDAAWYGVRLSEGAIDSFYVRVVLPGLPAALDGDSLQVAITVRDHDGQGTDDTWPNGKVFVDTSGVLIHTRTDTLVDYGDTQTDTATVAVAGSRIGVRSVVDKATTPPGDTLAYKIYYDNDGSAATQDTVFIQQLLPKYVDYTVSSAGGGYHIGEAGTQLSFSARATQTVFDRATAWADATPESVAGIRWKLMTAIGAQSGGDAAGVVDDTVADNDGGYVQFKVIVK